MRLGRALKKMKREGEIEYLRYDAGDNEIGSLDEWLKSDLLDLNQQVLWDKDKLNRPILVKRIGKFGKGKTILTAVSSKPE